MSHATNNGVYPCSFKKHANLPAVVVLPEPCNPANNIFKGFFENAGSVFSPSFFSPPKRATSSSFTIFTISCSGSTFFVTSRPIASFLTRSINTSATSTFTSASINARLISSNASEMFFSEIFPIPRRFLKTLVNLSVIEENIFFHLISITTA